MEHRDEHRTHASMKVMIYKADMPAAIAVTRDISKKGMFVLTNFMDVDPNQPLEFELLYNRRRATARKRYKTLLIEKRSDGLALKFDETNEKEARRLAAMVEWVASIHATNCLRKTQHRLVYISDLMSAQNAADNGVSYGLGTKGSYR